MKSKIADNVFFCLFVFTLFFGVLLYNVIGFKLMDEISGFILLFMYGIYIFTTKSKKSNTGIFFTLLVFAFYLCYSIFVSYNTATAIVFDFLIQIRPYLTFFIVAQIAPSFSESQKSQLKRLCFFMWLFFIPIGIYGLINAMFLYSVFGHPSNYITNISCLSLVYLFCSNFSIRKRFIFIIMFSAGLFATNTIFYTIFLLACGILLYFHHSDILKFNLRTGIAIGVVTLIILHITSVQITTDLLPVNNFTADYNLPPRSVLYQTAIDIVSKDFIPLGSGLASFGTDASGLYYSKIYSQYGLNTIDGLTPQNWFSVSDSYYPSLAQFGIIGIILYLFFWGGIIYKSFVKFRQNGDIQLLAIILIITSFVFIENLSDSFLTSNKGYFTMMFLGVLFGKNKKSFYVDENNKNIGTNPEQANLQTDNIITIRTDNDDIDTSEKVFQMPPIPIREENSSEKNEATIEHIPHPPGKNEIDYEIYNDDDDYYTDDDDEDYYDDNDDNFNETDKLLETNISTDQEIADNKQIINTPEIINQNKQINTESDSINLVTQTEDNATNNEESHTQDSEEDTLKNNISEKDTILIEGDLQSFNSLVDEDDEQTFIPSPPATPTHSDTEQVIEPTPALNDDLLTHTSLVDDNDEELQKLLSALQNDTNKVENNASMETSMETEPETDKTKHISDQNVPTTTEPLINESFNISKQEEGILDTANIDIEKIIVTQQVKLELTKPESDLVKEYREIVEEHITPKKENINQEISEVDNYIKYLEDFLKPIKQDNTNVLNSKEENNENNEPEEQIDYII